MKLIRNPTPILFTIPNLITAGSGRAMFNIVQRLDRSKFSPAICVLKKGGTIDKEIEDLGIPFLEAPFVISARPYFSLLNRAKKTAKIFKSYGFKLWHSFHYMDDYTEAVIARFSGAKYIYTKKNMNWHTEAWFLRSFLASRIAAQNTDMMRCFFSSAVLKNKATIIPRGIDTNKFHTSNSSLELKDRLKIPKDAKLVVCVADLVPVKGHPTLVEALSKLPENTHLALAGKPLDGNYVLKIKKMVESFNIQNRVHWLGSVVDIAALLLQSDIAVLSTWGKWRMEGCPVALLEAMGCGKACIATDIPGSRDIIQDGKNGFLVPPENPEALAEKIRELLNNKKLEEELGKAARQTILSKYTIEREVRDHEMLYEQVLS